MQTPAVAQLMGAYFHQDWFDAGSEEEVVDLFIHDQPELAPRVPDEVAQILEAFTGDDQVADYLRSLGSAYNPRQSFGGYRNWLTAIAERARQRRA